MQGMRIFARGRDHPDSQVLQPVSSSNTLRDRIYTAKRYASADVFLFPSETETFGNVTLEAMASGLVVVAYNYAAAHMHIAHGETGVLVPYRDANAFIDAAARLARQPQSLPKIRRQAHAYVAALDWQGVVQRFETLLTGVFREPQTAAEA